MAERQVAECSVVNGVVTAFVPGAGAPPALELSVGDGVVEGLEIAETRGGWIARATLPPQALNDGQTAVLLRRAGDGEVLARIGVRVGDAADADLAAEVAFLRAELDMLKRAFRRHCLESGP